MDRFQNILMVFSPVLLILGFYWFFLKKMKANKNLNTPKEQVYAKLREWQAPPPLSNQACPRKTRVRFNGWVILLVPLLPVLFLGIDVFPRLGDGVEEQGEPFGLGVLLVLTFVFLLSRLLTQRRILREGVVTGGLVTSSFTYRGSTSVSYLFIDSEGCLLQGKSPIDTDSEIKEGSLITVVYLKENPKVNSAYPSAMIALV